MSELKQRVTLEAYDAAVMGAYPVGTIFELPNGCLWRRANAGRGWRHCQTQLIRMTKQTANGWVLKAGEQAFLVARPGQTTEVYYCIACHEQEVAKGEGICSCCNGGEE